MENNMDNINENLDEITDTVLEKSEEDSFLSDSISRIRARMTSENNKTYGPPSVPETPSKVINDMLQTRCGHQFTSSVKYYIAAFICLIFSAVVKMYGLIYKKADKPSHTMWMAACAIVSVEHVVACWIIYYIVICCSFLLHHFLYYGFVVVTLFGVGVAVSGMVFFDKDKAKVQSPGFEKAE